MKIFSYLLALVMSLALLAGCGGGGGGGGGSSSGTPAQKMESTFKKWISGFNARNLSKVRSCYSASYLQNGFTRDDELDFMADVFAMSDEYKVSFQGMVVDDYDVDGSQEFGILYGHGTMKEQTRDNNGNWQTEYTDVDYEMVYRNEGGNWLYYGNHETKPVQSKAPAAGKFPLTGGFSSKNN